MAGFLTLAFLFTFSLLDVLGAGLDGLVLQEDLVLQGKQMCCNRTQILMDLLGKSWLNPTQSAQREELWSSWCSTILLM